MQKLNQLLSYTILIITLILSTFLLLACEDPNSQNQNDMKALSLNGVDQGAQLDPILNNVVPQLDQEIWNQDQSNPNTNDTLDMNTNQALDMSTQSNTDQSSTQTDAYMSGSDMDICGEFVQEAGRALLPVDVIWVIDSSPSMGEEIEQIQNNLNTFTQRITESGLDIKVVVVASEADYYGTSQDFIGVCIPPPLSGANQCPDVDSDHYYHARINVHSRDALDRFIDAYPDMQRFLRPYAYKHVVFVTDDDAGWDTSAMDWFNFIQNTIPSFFMDGLLQVHSIVDLVGYQNGCILDEAGCSCGEERGQEYINLSEQTMGLVYSICETDWSPLFDRLEQQVFTGSQLECTYAIPEEIAQRPDVEDLINVYWSPSLNQAYVLVPQVENAEACTGDVGWYYDDSTATTSIQLCPTSCNGDQGAVRIEFGCMVIKR